MEIRRSTWVFGGVAMGSLVLASILAPLVGGGSGLGGPGTALVVGGGGPASLSAGRVRLDARLDAARVLLGGGGEAWLAVTLAADAIADKARAPLNLAIVIDASGSMAGEPLANAKLAAKEMIGRLAGGDRVALVAYGSYGAVLVPSTPLDGAARERLDAAIDGLSDMGGTNINDGLDLARTEVARGATGEHVNRVVLLSDGEANAGAAQDAAGLGAVARSMAGGGIAVTAMGLGTSYDEDTMMAIAEHGGGKYYFIESPKQLADIFAKEFGAMASVVARGTEVEIVPADGVTVAEVVGYPSERRGAAVVIRPGDLYGGQERKIVLRLAVPAGAEGALTVAQVKLAFADALDAGKLVVAAASVTATVVADATLVAESRDKDVAAKVETVKMARKLEEASRAFEAGDADKATVILGEAKAGYAAATASGLAMPAAPAAAVDDLEGYLDAGKKGDARGGEVFKKKAKASSMELSK